MSSLQSSRLIHNVLTAHRSQIGFTDALLELQRYVEDLEDENRSFLEIGELHQSTMRNLLTWVRKNNEKRMK